MAHEAGTIPNVAKPVEGLDVERLREAIREEYSVVATHPDRGFHFHTGRPLARILGYEESWLEGIPEATIASFAGTGSPFRLGVLRDGERVVDVGCGAGIDALIASRMVGDRGYVVGVDMTPAMIDRARASAAEIDATNIEFCHGVAESLPVPNGWADVVISNGVLNLFPDKAAGLAEMARVLAPGGRLQIADILVQKTVGDRAKLNIDLWKG